MDGNATYNGNSLQTYDRAARTGINLQLIAHTDLPQTAGDVVPLANISDSEAPTFLLQSKTISLAGTISGSTQADLDSRIDAFKSIFNKRNVNLDIVYSGTIRRYTALKLGGISIDRSNMTLWAKFKVDIICKPFGYEVSSTSLANLTGVTTASSTITGTIAGSAAYQMPIFTITLTALTGTGDYLQISNDTNGQQITISGIGLASGDVITVNSQTRKVQRNGTDVDYTGTFIEFEPGSFSVTVTDGFTTRTKSIQLGYYKRYW